jgi:hypothetical protein
MNEARIMQQQLLQVLLSYWRWITSGWAMMLTAVMMVFFNAMMAFADLPRRVAEISPLLIFNLYVTAGITFQLKRQILQIRERRLPHALWAHLLVGLAALFLFTLGFPMIPVLLGTPMSLGHFGIISISAAIVVWIVVSESWWAISFFFIPYVLLQRMFVSYPGWEKVMANFFAGRYEGVGMAMFAMGIAGVALGVSYLVRMDEEDPRYVSKFHQFYRRSSDLGQQQVAGRVGDESYKAIWKSRWLKFSDPMASAVATWPILARGSLGDRVKLWLVTRGGQASWRAITPTIVLGLFWVWWMLSDPKFAVGASPMVAIYTMIPFFASVGVWEQQRPMWAAELLRPVSRPQFYKEVGLGMVRQFVTTWSITAMIFIIASFFAVPDPDARTKIIKLILLVGSSQAVLFGLLVLTMRSRSRAKVILAAICITPAYMGLWFWMNSHPPEWSSLAIISVGMLSLGAAISYYAYRRWIVAELG